MSDKGPSPAPAPAYLVLTGVLIMDYRQRSVSSASSQTGSVFPSVLLSGELDTLGLRDHIGACPALYERIAWVAHETSGFGHSSHRPGIVLTF